MTISLKHFLERAKTFWLGMSVTTAIILFFFAVTTSASYWITTYINMESMRGFALMVLRAFQIVWGGFIVSMILALLFYFGQKILTYMEYKSQLAVTEFVKKDGKRKTSKSG